MMLIERIQVKISEFQSTSVGLSVRLSVSRHPQYFIARASRSYPSMCQAGSRDKLPTLRR